MKLIGIGGTNGSGKDSLGQILADDYGFMNISVSDILRNELKLRKKPIERENLRSLSAEWRRQLGHGVLIDMAYKIYEPQEGKYKGLAVASLRNPGEADEIHKLGGKVVWLDANPEVRYGRIFSRRRSTEDYKSYDEFLAEEKAEMQHHGGDDSTLNMSGVKAKADIFINNSNNDMEEFKRSIAKALKGLV